VPSGVAASVAPVSGVPASLALVASAPVSKPESKVAEGEGPPLELPKHPASAVQPESIQPRSPRMRMKPTVPPQGNVVQRPLPEGRYHGRVGRVSRVSSQRVPGGVVHKLPEDLRKALVANPAALAPWMDITPLARNEFICWVEDAKQPTTRDRRIRRTQEELEEGMRRPCCWPGCSHRERTGK
jgi:hypothetical protein